MKIISISTDRNIFNDGSAVRARQIEYSTIFDELHIVIFGRFTSFFPKKQQISSNVWIYSTNSISRFLYIPDAMKIARRIIKDGNMTSANTIITVQDPFETGLVGVSLKKKFGFPLHVQIHTDFLSPFFLKQSFINKIRTKVAIKELMYADAIRVVSIKIADSLKNIKLRSGIIPEILPIFVDINKIEQTPVTVDLKKKYPQFNFIILMVSRLSGEKNIHFAIEMFKRLVNFYQNIGLVIVGSGSEEKRLRKLVSKLGLENSVIFEPWTDNPISYFKTANLFISTSNFEGYGLTIIEATASHCPIVSTDVGIASDLIDPCAVGDIDCFLDRISSLIEDIGLRERLVHISKSKLSQVVIQDKAEYLLRLKKNIESALRR